MSRDFLEKMYGLSRRRAEELAAPTDAGPPVRSLKAALLSPGMAVIAEVKYATPADGMLGVNDAPDVIAREYERLGASAVSCLTEPEYFAGRLEYLAMVRSSCSLPVMMKDFIVDERQIIAGRSFGADAVLLVTEMLCLEELRRCMPAHRTWAWAPGGGPRSRGHRQGSGRRCEHHRGQLPGPQDPAGARPDA